MKVKLWTILVILAYLTACTSSCLAEEKIVIPPLPTDNAEHQVISSGNHGVFPDNRLVVYYGNFHSPAMGILGEYPAPELWKRLKTESQEWEKADPSKPVITGLEYIATVASSIPGKDKLYRNRMSNAQIQKALSMVRMVDGAVLILDIQPGLSDLMNEITRIEPFLIHSDVHLAIDPEFMGPDKTPPGRKIGSISYKKINNVIDYLSQLVVKYQLPPKILVVHRFTKKMVTGFDKVKSDPNVQVVLNMDGWGTPTNKAATYRKVIPSGKNLLYPGIKLFYKNDVKYPPHHLLSKEKILSLQPQPIYIQYQ